MTFLTDSFDIPFDEIYPLFIINRYRKKWSKNLFVRKLDSHPFKFISFGLKGLLEWPIMNEKGVGLGYAAILARGDGSREIDEGEGLSSTELWTLAIASCKNVKEIAKFYEESERECKKYRGNIFSDTPAWCDKEGGILLIEYSHNYILNIFGNSTEITKSYPDILWHTNSHQWIDPELTGSIDPDEYGSSYLRMNRAKYLLEENYGDITLDTCKEILRDHGGGYKKHKKDSGDICRHPDLRGIVVTTIAWIINPQEMKFYITHGSPCNNEFICYDAIEIFEKYSPFTFLMKTLID
jgi:hypothetical protein